MCVCVSVPVCVCVCVLDKWPYLGHAWLWRIWFLSSSRHTSSLQEGGWWGDGVEEEDDRPVHRSRLARESPGKSAEWSTVLAQAQEFLNVRLIGRAHTVCSSVALSRESDWKMSGGGSGKLRSLS